MARIHPTAIVEDGVRLGADVVIGPFCVVGPDVDLRDGVVLHSHVVVQGKTTLGERTQVYSFASLGQPGQVYKNTSEIGRLEIGARCEIREYVTINCGSPRGDLVTRIGEDCMLMVGAHVAHDCQIGNKVIFANNATLGGHVIVGDHVFFGGLCAVHQFCWVGEHAIIAGVTGLRGHLIPYGSAIGAPATLEGLNVVGLERRGFKRDQIRNLNRGYRKLFHGAGVFAERLLEAERDSGDDMMVTRLCEFIRSADDRRPLCMPPVMSRGGGAR